MSKKLSKEEIETRLKTLHNGEYIFLTEYINNKTPVKIKHKVCGNEYTISRIDRFFNNKDYKCPKCNLNKPPIKKERITEEGIIQKIKTYFNDEFEYVSGFTKMHNSIKIKHTKCNNIFIINRATDLFNNRFVGCPFCRVNKRGIYQKDNDYLQHALDESLDGNEYTWLDTDFKGPKIHHKIRHDTCRV